MCVRLHEFKPAGGIVHNAEPKNRWTEWFSLILLSIQGFVTSNFVAFLMLSLVAVDDILSPVAF